MIKIFQSYFIFRILLVFFTFSSFQISFAHIRLDSPAPRPGTTDGTKTSNPNNPCAGLARGPAPITMTAGSTMSFTWTETVNHPGRFIIQFSPENDLGFDFPVNELFRKEDTQNRATHTAQIKVPTKPCERCSMRLVQVMGDQPGQLYVQCVDLKIVAAEGSQNTGNLGNEVIDDGSSNISELSSSSVDGKVDMPSGCAIASGRVMDINNSSNYFLRILNSLFLLLIPLALYSLLRRKLYYSYK